MKHIKKKFLNEIELTPEVIETLHNSPMRVELDENFKNIPKQAKGKVPFFTTYDNLFYQGFFLKVQGKIRVIPEPDPILVYFHAAYVNYVNLVQTKKKLLELTEITLGSEPAINELYEFFGQVSTFVIFLFTTIEACMNRAIPSTFIYVRPTNKSTENFTKEQIERHISFGDKIKYVLPSATGKDFFKNYKLKFQQIENLKVFRDDIIHTKQTENGAASHNYRKAFDFDYMKALTAVKDFCNFYIKDDFVIDCECNKEW
jgi:hypothetical protein